MVKSSVPTDRADRPRRSSAPTVRADRPSEPTVRADRPSAPTERADRPSEPTDRAVWLCFAAELVFELSQPSVESTPHYIHVSTHLPAYPLGR